MPWGDGTGPAGRGPVGGRGRGSCKGVREPGIVPQILTSLALGLLTWGGRALSRRTVTSSALPNPEPVPSLTVLPNQAAIGAGTREATLAELHAQAQTLAQQLEALQEQIRRLESQGLP